MQINEAAIKDAVATAVLTGMGAKPHEESVKATSPCVGKFCVVRAGSAGVHVGTVESVDGQTVVLSSASRVWRWRGAKTLHELALRGSATEEHTRISKAVELVQLPTALEVIPCTAEAQANLEKPRWL